MKSKKRVKTYRKGADYEREVVKRAREQGCIAFRSAGSHSPIDVCVIDTESKEVLFLQLKTYDTKLKNGEPNKEERDFNVEFKPLEGDYNVKFDFR